MDVKVGREVSDISIKDKLTEIQKNISIIASGPSLNEVSGQELQHVLLEPTIFVNGAIAILDRVSSDNIVGYVVTDPRFIEHNFSAVEAFYEKKNDTKFYMTKSVLEKIYSTNYMFYESRQDKFRIIRAQKESRSLLEKLTSKLLIFFKKNHVNPNINVSENLLDGFYEAGTVAFVAAQLAFFLGTKKITLYGVDLLNSKQPRFYETMDKKAPNMLNKAIYNRIVPAFDLMAEKYASHGVEVINASPVSRNLFEKVRPIGAE